MRENSGKGDSHTGLLDPTIKEREAEQGRSGKAVHKEHETGDAHGGDLEPPQSDEEGRRKSPESGPPDRH